MASLGSLVATIRVDTGGAMAQVRSFANNVQTELTRAFAGGGVGNAGAAQMKAISDATRIAAAEIQKAALSLDRISTSSATASTSIGSMAKQTQAAAKAANEVDIAFQRIQLRGAGGQFAGNLASQSGALGASLRNASVLPGILRESAEMARRLRAEGEAMDLATGRIARNSALTRGYLQSLQGTFAPIANHARLFGGAMDIASRGAANLGRNIRVTIPALQHIAREAQRLGAYMDIASKEAVELKTNFGPLRDLVTTIGLLGGTLIPGGLGNIVSGVALLSRGFIGLQSAMSSVSGTAIAVFGVLSAGLVAAVAAMAGFVSLVKEIASTGTQAAIGIERITISFEAMLGSVSAARNEIGSLIQLARESPFKLDTLLNLDRLLISQGVGAVRGELIPAINDMASAFGLADDNIQSIGVAIAQLFGRGYVSGDELRQLYNQFVPVWNILREIPEFAELSQSALRKLSEEGVISAQQFGDAYVSYAAKFRGAAEAQADAVAGLLLRLEEVREAGLGLAFLQVEAAGTGPLEVIRRVLGGIVEELEAVDLRPLADSIGQLFNALAGPIEGIQQGIGGLTAFFETHLPRAIRTVAGFISAFTQNIHGISGAFGAVWNVVRQVAPLIGVAFAVAFGSVVSSINVAIGAFTALISAVGVTIGFVRTLFALLTGGDAGAAFSGVMDSVRGVVSGIQGLVTGAARGVKAALDVYKSFQDIDVVDFGEMTAAATPPVEEWENTADAAKKAAGSAGDMARAMNELWEITRRFFGRRSDLEQGLLGDVGFEATADQIASMGKRLIEALRSLGASDAARQVEQSILRLLDLAKRREEVAEALKAAEQKLADAIKARDDFARKITDSSIKFANALRVEEKTSQKWRHVAQQGFFVLEEVRNQGDFVQALRERLAALRQFLKDIRTLRERGLDQGFLEDLLSAGPEQAGGIARALVEGGQTIVKEVNVLQGSIRKVATELGQFGAKEFYQAGVDQAQGLVNGLQGEMNVITAAAIEIGELVYATVLPYARKMKDAGGALAGGIASGIAGGAPKVSGAMGNISKGIDTESKKWKQFIAINTEGIMEPPRAALEGWLGDLEASTDDFITWADSIADSIQTELDKIEIDVLKWLPTLNLGNWLQKVRKWVNDVFFGGMSFDDLPKLFGERIKGGGTRTGSTTTTTKQLAAPSVTVYIGDTQLKEVIRTEMTVQDGYTSQQIVRSGTQI